MVVCLCSVVVVYGVQTRADGDVTMSSSVAVNQLPVSRPSMQWFAAFRFLYSIFFSVAKIHCAISKLVAMQCFIV